MDPELKAALRGLKPGSKEYQKALDKFNSDKARNQGEIELRKAKIASDAADAEAKRKRDEAKSQADIEATKKTAQEEHNRQTSLITAGSTAGGLTAGLAGGYAADKYGTAKANATLTARSEGARNLAAAAREIDPGQVGARARYSAIGQAADKTGVLNPRVVPYGGLGMAGALGGMGAYSTFHRAPEAQSDEERALWTGTGYGEMGAGAKMLASSVNRYANPSVQLPPEALADIEFARQQGAGKAPLGGYDRTQPAQIAQGENTAPSEPQPVRLRNSERLINAAREAGATGKLTKTDAAKWLARRVTDDNRAAVADALGVKPGDDFGPRIKNAIKDMAKSPGRSGIILPLAMGAVAYDAARSQAKAAGSQNPESAGIGAGLTAAGTTAAIPYAISKLPASLANAARATGPGLAPSGIDSMTDYSPQEMAQAANWQARNLPSWARSQGVENAYQMAQVPERNPFDTVMSELDSHLGQE